MIKVYFETDNGHAEEVAIFESEDVYMACFPALDWLREKHGFTKITESITEED